MVFIEFCNNPLSEMIGAGATNMAGIILPGVHQTTSDF
jgi:hypothetical protein